MYEASGSAGRGFRERGRQRSEGGSLCVAHIHAPLGQQRAFTFHYGRAASYFYFRLSTYTYSLEQSVSLKSRVIPVTPFLAVYISKFFGVDRGSIVHNNMASAMATETLSSCRFLLPRRTSSQSAEANMLWTRSVPCHGSGAWDQFRYRGANRAKRVILAKRQVDTSRHTETRPSIKMSHEFFLFGNRPHPSKLKVPTYDVCNVARRNHFKVLVAHGSIPRGSDDVTELQIHSAIVAKPE